MFPAPASALNARSSSTQPFTITAYGQSKFSGGTLTIK